MFEFNGIANIQMLLSDPNVKIDKELKESILKELDNVERYMLAVSRHIKSEYVAMGSKAFHYEVKHSKKIPFWHEIKADHKLYPNRKELTKGKNNG